MRQARPGHDHMRRILVIDGSEHPPLLQRAGEVDGLADAPVGDELAQRRAFGDRLSREVEG